MPSRAALDDRYPGRAAQIHTCSRAVRLLSSLAAEERRGLVMFAVDDLLDCLVARLFAVLGKEMAGVG